MAYGYEGVGLFYCILEKIALQEQPVKTDVLKKQLFVGKKLEKCWKYLEEIDLISSNNAETFNKQLLNFSEKFKIKKEKNRERISKWRENQDDKKNVTRYESVRNNDKVNKSKVNISNIKDEAFLIIEFCKPLFEEKYLTKKTAELFDKLLNEYSAEKIKEAISNAKNDIFWAKNFLSPVKLNNKNKDQVKYIDVFLQLKKQTNGQLSESRRVNPELNPNSYWEDIKNKAQN